MVMYGKIRRMFYREHLSIISFVQYRFEQHQRRAPILLRTMRIRF